MTNSDEKACILLVLGKVIEYLCNQLQKKITNFKKSAANEFHLLTTSGEKCVKFDDF